MEQIWRGVLHTKMISEPTTSRDELVVQVSEVMSKIRGEIGMSQEVCLPRHQGTPRERSRKGLTKEHTSHQRTPLITDKIVGYYLALIPHSLGNKVIALPKTSN